MLSVLEEDEDKEEENPMKLKDEDEVAWYSHLFFSWASPVISVNKVLTNILVRKKEQN